MEACNICLTRIKKRSKSEHEQSKEHKYFSNLIINKYFVRNSEVINIKTSFSHTMIGLKRNSIFFLYVLGGRKMKCL